MLRPEWLDFFERTDVNAEVESIQLRRIAIIGTPWLEATGQQLAAESACLKRWGADQIRG